VILLDTNVVSEPMRPKPDRRVLGWLDAQAAESLYLSTVSLAELLLGIESLPVGKRRKALAAALNEQIIALFGERIVALGDFAQDRLGFLASLAKLQLRADRLATAPLASAILHDEAFMAVGGDHQPEAGQLHIPINAAVRARLGFGTLDKSR